MTTLQPPDVECVHVVCVDVGGPCQYQPPAIGPDLPECVIAVDGSAWTRHGGGIYYSPKPGGGYLMSSRGAVIAALSGVASSSWGDFPVGDWRDGYQPPTPEQQSTHESWQTQIRQSRAS